ncbi:MAG: CHAD domain-containing protein [Candidatus Binatia bacterium]
MATEVELKLSIAPDDVEKLLQHPVWQKVVRRELMPQQLLSVYYDTPEFDLYKNRIALRLRRAGNRWIQTVKTQGRVAGGLHQRAEWETETEENQLNFAALTNPVVSEFFADPKIRQTLRPVFVTDFRRSITLLEFADGSMVEFALDQGEIRADDQRLPLGEVEFELKAGDPARLFWLALEFLTTIPLKVENVSKAERGYNLLCPSVLDPVKAHSPELTGQESVSEAFLCIVQAELVHLQANEAGALAGEDPEFVHQMRVALRRMRSAISVFSALVVQQEDSGTIRTELRWLTNELDAARNWDVFVLSTLPPILSAFSEQRGLTELHTRSEEIRQREIQRVRAAVASPRYQRLLLTLGAWLCTQPWRTSANAQAQELCDVSVVSFARQMLRKRHKQLKKRGKHLTGCSPEQRHNIRITTKKLRYAAEFFSSLYPRKRTHRYVAALTELQDVLGTLNDAATTMLLMHDVTTVTQGEALLQAKSTVLGWAGGMSHALETELERAWNNFATQKVFW